MFRENFSFNFSFSRGLSEWQASAGVTRGFFIRSAKWIVVESDFKVMCPWFLLLHARRAHLRLRSMIRMILSVEGYERVPFPTSASSLMCAFSLNWTKESRRDDRGRERKRDRATRYAYEIGGRGDIKVVPSVRRGATADKWPEILAKSCARRGKLFFTGAENERAGGREKRKRFISARNLASRQTKPVKNHSWYALSKSRNAPENFARSGVHLASVTIRAN